MYKFPAYVKIIAILLVLFIMGSVIPPQEVKADAPTAYTFTTFNTTTITSNGVAPFSLALNTTGMPANDYLFFTVVADYKTGGSAWSSFMTLNFTDGASTTYYQKNGASQGALTSASNATLYWSGILEREYTGGGNLTIQFTDGDTSGAYTSSLENVVVTIYPAPTTSTTFASFGTGTITSGDGVGFTKSLDFSSLPYGYLFFTIVADWSPVASSDAWSQSMKMGFYDGSTVFFPQYSARQGAANNNTATTLYWSGIFQREYTGGGNLTIKFIDNDPGSYTSQLTNVTVSIYPSPTLPKTFTTFTTDTITDGGAYTHSLDVTGLAADDYLFFTVVADFKGISNPPSSNNVNLTLTNGSGVTFFGPQAASQGSASSAADTTLYWSGYFQRKYTGGGNLTIQFSVIEYPSETVTCRLENVKVTIYRGAGTGVTAVQLNDLKASTVKGYLPFILVGLVVSVGLIPTIKRRLLSRRLDTDR